MGWGAHIVKLRPNHVDLGSGGMAITNDRLDCLHTAREGILSADSGVKARLGPVPRHDLAEAVVRPPFSMFSPLNAVKGLTGPTETDKHAAPDPTQSVACAALTTCVRQIRIRLFMDLNSRVACRPAAVAGSCSPCKSACWFDTKA